MAFLDFLRKKKSSKEIDVEEASKKAKKKDNATGMSSGLKKIMMQANSLFNSSAYSNRDQFSYQEFDLNEIKIAINSDSYLKISALKYGYMLFKAGYRLKSINEAASDYVTMRLKIMSIATGKPFDILLQEVGDDLIRYSNAFLVKSRVNSIMPGIKAKGFFTNKVVGGYYRISPEQVICKRNKNGKIVKYIQMSNGEEKEFDPINVIHFYLDKEPGNFLGTPRLNAALEDVKMLRSIEGFIVAMIHRFAMPLFHWKVGLPQTGMQATQSDIDRTKKEVDYMSIDGSIVTSEKTEVKVVGAEGNAISAESYLKYFEDRVFTSIGVSASQMGRGGSKQDADSMESQAHDTVKFIQRIMKIFTEHYIISEILLEGGFNPILNKEDEVHFEFLEINLDTKIKVENHEMAKFQGNMISFEEMRKEIGMTEEADIKDFYKFLVEVEADKLMTQNKTKGSIDIAKVTGEQAMDLAKFNAENSLKIAKMNAANSSANSTSSSGSSSAATKGKKSAGAKGNGTNKSTAPNKDIKNKNTPANQHGTTSVKIKEAHSNVIKSKKKHKKTYESIYRKYYTLAEDLIAGKDDIDFIFPVALESMCGDMKTYLNLSSMEGIVSAAKDVNKNNIIPNINIKVYEFEDMAKKDMKKLLKEIQKKVKYEKNPIVIKSTFEALEYRLRFIIEYMIPKIYWYSYLKAGQVMGFEKAEVNFNGSEDEKTHDKIINLNKIDLDKIPPYHPFCDCEIKFKRGD